MPIVTIENEKNSGNRKGWTKYVQNVDMYVKDGYAFDGKFLNDGEYDLEIGAVLIQKNPEGSVKHAHHVGIVLIVQKDGSLKRVGKPYNWRKEFLSFRCFVAARLKIETNPFDGFTDDELITEFFRRKLHKLSA